MSEQARGGSARVEGGHPPPATPGQGRGFFRGRGRGRGRAAYLMRRQQSEILSGWRFTLSALGGFAFPPFQQVHLVEP